MLHSKTSFPWSARLRCLAASLLAWSAGCSRGEPLQNCSAPADCGPNPTIATTGETGETDDTGASRCIDGYAECLDGDQLARCDAQTGELVVFACSDLCGPDQPALGCGRDESGEPRCRCGESDPDTGGPGDPLESTGAATDATTAGAEECPDPSDEPGPEVTVEIRNDGDAPIYINESLCDGTLLEITGPSPWPHVLRTQLNPCEFTCDMAAPPQEVLCESCSLCSDLGVTMLAPGASMFTSWSGVDYRPYQLALNCQNCGETCTATARAEDGGYTITVPAYTEVADCTECTCTPNEHGICEVYGAPAGQQMMAKASVNYPSQQYIALTFP